MKTLKKNSEIKRVADSTYPDLSKIKELLSDGWKFVPKSEWKLGKSEKVESTPKKEGDKKRGKNSENNSDKRVAQTGKDKFVEFFEKVAKDLRVKNFSSIDRVKQIAEVCFGWKGRKDDKSRKFLADIKHSWSEFNNGPFYYIKAKIEDDMNYTIVKQKDTTNNIYFVHIREPKEIHKMKIEYGEDCITLLVKKDGREVPDNHADKNVDKYEYDFIIENYGSEKDLKEKAKIFLEDIKKAL